MATNDQIVNSFNATVAAIGSDMAGKQPRDAGLTSLATKTSPGLYYLSADDVWSPVTIGSGLLFSGGVLSATAIAPVGGALNFSLAINSALLGAI